jgi:hypothetical protein
VRPGRWRSASNALIVDDRQTCRTAIAVDAVFNQRHRDQPCAFCTAARPSAACSWQRSVDKGQGWLLGGQHYLLAK